MAINYSQQDMYEAALRAGFLPAEAQVMSAIGMGESGGRGDATNPNGEYSVGPLQINLNAHSSSIDEDSARDIDKAMAFAYQLSRGGKDFSPWSVFTNGSYQQFLGGDAPAATGGSSMTDPGLTNLPEGWNVIQIGGQIIGFTDDLGEFHAYSPAAAASQSRVGTATPAPINAANSLIDKYRAEIESGRFQADQAWNQFQKELGEANFGLSRDVNRADVAIKTQNEVGERAKTTLSALKGMTTAPQLNVPFLNEIFGGQVQGTPVNFPQLFDQGTGGLASIPQVMPQAPTFSPMPTFAPPTMPNLGGLLGAGAAGFPGWNVGGTAAPAPALPTTPPVPAWPAGPAPFAGAFGFPISPDHQE